MRPETLPKAYQDFIQKTGPVAQPVYKVVRDCCRGYPVDITALSAYLSQRRQSGHVKLEEFPLIIPCSVIHPDTSSCLAHNWKAMSAMFKKTFPLYFSLTFVPFVVLCLQNVRISLKLLALETILHEGNALLFIEWKQDKTLYIDERGSISVLDLWVCTVTDSIPVILSLSLSLTLSVSLSLVMELKYD